MLDLLVKCILLAAGFVLLVKGADWFVDGAAGIADRFGVPQLVIGLTIVAMGTSAPEAAVSITAALKGNAGITIGNIVGSNILNVLVILGLTAVIVATPVAKSTIRCEIPYMIGITVLLLVFGCTGHQVGFLEGLMLWGAFLLYLAYLLHMALQEKQETERAADRRSFWKLLVMAVGGLFLVVCGSDMTVEGAVGIAARMGLSERLIGLTIVALGTSLPELFTSVSAALKGKSDIAIGNIVGSNVFNVLFVVGTTALITPVTFEPRFVADTLMAVGAGVLLLVCVARHGRLARTAGVLMLASYGGYFLWLTR